MRIVANPKVLFVVLVILGFGLRIGYGLARYRGNITHLSGGAFVAAWSNDALVHVLIAEALLSGKGYVVDDSPVAFEKHIPYIGQEALFKAPLYEFFLAAVFAISGFSFKLFFPLQALFGGLLTGLIGLITLHVFRRPAAAWFAGVATGVHPILVNSASQPYNEDLFFVLFAAAILAFLIWLENRRMRWAFLCGVMVGLCTLTRENGTILLVAMGAVLFLVARRTTKAWIGYGLIILTAVAVVAPWTIRNYVRFGVFVPVASIVGVDFTEGNNECVASEGIFVPYWAEGPCHSAAEQARAQPGAAALDPRIPAAVRHDHVSRRIAAQFVLAHPGAYAKLAIRRFWTTLLPYNPRANQRLQERFVLFLYWLLVFPAGIVGMIVGIRRTEPGRLFLGLLIVLNLLSIMAILYWSDLRFRVGIDLLLSCFAGWLYSGFLYQRIFGNVAAALSEQPETVSS
jgi:4-amino-4-deoxy-L-arabinose transferase-like glycosyltransferase